MKYISAIQFGSTVCGNFQISILLYLRVMVARQFEFPWLSFLWHFTGFIFPIQTRANIYTPVEFTFFFRYEFAYIIGLDVYL
jgi:hypothetical protein